MVFASSVRGSALLLVLVLALILVVLVPVPAYAATNENECAAVPQPREGPTSTGNPPSTWCTISARVTARSSCNIGVEESILVPWTSGRMDRILIVPVGRVMEVSAYQVIDPENNGRIPLKVGLPPSPMAGTHDIAYNVSIYSAQTTTSQTRFVLRYVLHNALRHFQPCPHDDGLFDTGAGNGASASEVNGMMIAWRPGAMAPADIANVKAIMVIPDKLVDVATRLKSAVAPNGWRSINQSRPGGGGGGGASAATETQITLIPRNASPSLLSFYTLFKPRSGEDSTTKCPGYRKCINEKHANRMKSKQNKPITVTTWILIAIGSILTAFLLALIVLCIRRKTKPEPSLVDEDEDARQHPHSPTGNFLEVKLSSDNARSERSAVPVSLKDVTLQGVDGRYLN